MPDPHADWPLDGHPAIVVTGASSGIGRALALAAPAGARLLLVGRDQAALDAVAAARGAGAGTLGFDLTRPDAAAALGAALASRGWRCEVLVNNAGVGRLGDFAGTDPAGLVALFDLNLRTPAALMRAALPGMLARRAGGVLNIGSVAGYLPGPGMAAYYASKAGLRSLSEAVWAETRGQGVTVTCVCPGPVATAFFDRAGVGTAKLFRMMPKASAETVATRAWAGFRAGKRIVLPDAAAWATALSAPFLPRFLALPVVRQLQRVKGG